VVGWAPAAFRRRSRRFLVIFLVDDYVMVPLASALRGRRRACAEKMRTKTEAAMVSQLGHESIPRGRVRCRSRFAAAAGAAANNIATFGALFKLSTIASVTM
jgi:hypothetical protein